MNLIKRNSTFRSLFLCNVFNTMGSNLFSLAFIIYASTYPNSKMYISLAALLMVFPTFLNAYMGYLADHTINKKRALFITSWIQSGLFITVALVIAQRTLIIFLFCILMNLVDELFAMYKDGLELPIMQERVSSNDIQSAYGLMQGISSLIGIVGKPVGLMLLALLGHSFSILALVNAGLYLISGFVLLGSRNSLDVTVNLDQEKFHFSIKTTLSQIGEVFKRDQAASATNLIIMVLIINFSINGILPLIDLAMVHHNPFDSSFGFAVTVFSITFSLGIFISSIFMNDLFHKGSLTAILRTILVLLILFSLLIIPFGLAAVAVLFIIGYAFAKVNPKLTSIIIQMIPKEDLATVRGGISTFFATASSLGVLVYVALANIIGVNFTFSLIALSCLITILYPIFIKPNKEPLQ
ncbi:MFS transporter [Lactococcus allomyrinae]|uniref:MFS transporter n=1 Tax=Lactococcus allomyrinae TaxID=2419773 RepID=A0A387BC24_9LACT|nr:MFS transporter [Lactococcus allomyrinae]AYG01415.1 MFS transporter [Lactococcus allomyrinae]